MGIFQKFSRKIDELFLMRMYVYFYLKNNKRDQIYDPLFDLRWRPWYDSNV